MSQVYTGEVRNGVIVLAEGLSPLSEGTKVRIQAEAPDEAEPGGTPLLKLIDRLDEMPADPTWPEDGSSQHDHYLFGTPKRS